MLSAKVIKYMRLLYLLSFLKRSLCTFQSPNAHTNQQVASWIHTNQQVGSWHLSQSACVNFPEISRRYCKGSASSIIAKPVTINDHPVMQVSNKCRMVVHSVFPFFVVVSPLSNTVIAVLISPLITWRSQLRVIIVHSLKRVTGGGQDVRLTAEVLDYSFTWAVSCRGHVECTSLLFTAVES